MKIANAEIAATENEAKTPSAELFQAPELFSLLEFSVGSGCIKKLTKSL